ncbi:MAG: EVE domain-containing protein [Casimicrobiaceae bacterium]
MDIRRYFVVVAARDAVEAAVGGGYIEVNHGKAGPLERMRAGDGVVFYSPRNGEGASTLQAFTAIAWVVGAQLKQPDVAEDATRPFRRSARFVAAQPTSIRPLIDTLDFIRNKQHWGTALRNGFVQISRADFDRIGRALGRCDGLRADAAGSGTASDAAAVASGEPAQRGDGSPIA